jgi:hypothetical protein
MAKLVPRASPKLVPAPTVGTKTLPGSNSFQAWINTMGGTGAGSGRSAGLDSAHVIALVTKLVTSCGLGLTQKVVEGLGGGWGRESHPSIGTGIKGSGLFDDASIQSQLHVSESTEKG